MIAPLPQLGYSRKQRLHVLDGFAAAIRVQVSYEPVGDDADAREHDAPIACGLQVVEPLAPIAHPTQLDAVEARGGGELPLFEDAIAREELLLARELHVPSLELKDDLHGLAGVFVQEPEGFVGFVDPEHVRHELLQPDLLLRP